MKDLRDKLCFVLMVVAGLLDTYMLIALIGAIFFHKPWIRVFISGVVSSILLACWLGVRA